ncbi:MAG: SycD/LcrH family type III secretion system chaperone [Chlamydiota bacterium]|nr:SycD/LcrH family type III secretion system chaperone [Chlamydiota bacterium]
MEVKEIVDKVMDEYGPTFDEEEAKTIKTFLLAYAEDIINYTDENMPTDEDVKKQIDQTLDEHFSDESVEEKAKRKEFLEKIYLEGKTYAEAMGLDSNHLDALFSMGYNNYNAGKYQEAQMYFCYLTLLNNRDPRYFFSAGAAFQMQKDYSNAIAFYSQCTRLDWMNPMPWFHLADCYIKTEDFPNALMALKGVINRTKNDGMYAKINERAHILYNQTLEKFSEEIREFHMSE